MAGLIVPDELARWLPGETIFDSAARNWSGMRLIGRRYDALDVHVPAKEDFSIIVYKAGIAEMNRRCSSRWQTEPVSPGMVSMLTPTVDSDWRWNQKIDVIHFFLSPRVIAETAADVYECEIDTVALRDVLRAEDPVLVSIATQLEVEARQGGVGERAYVECIRLQASIHLLRRYANVKLQYPASSGQFTPTQKKCIVDFVNVTLDQLITLKDLSSLVGLSVFHFARKFRATFGASPHAWLLQQRVERAKLLLSASNLPLKYVSADSGFADQSHMTRVFHHVVGVTPGKYRNCMQRLRK